MAGRARLGRVPGMAYLIKRYPNRKLYDVQASRYVTLDDLAALIRGGTEIAVTDAATGEDLTAVVLTQIILDRERGGQAGLPAAFLHQFIKHGEAWQEAMARGLAATMEGMVESQREAERIFRTWAERSGLLPAAGAAKGSARESTRGSAVPPSRGRRRPGGRRPSPGPRKVRRA